MSEVQIKKKSRWLYNKTNQTCHKQHLVAENDRILICVSGGKDSLIMLEMLSKIRRSAPFKFELFAIHVHITNIGYKVGKEFLEEYCRSLEVPLVWVSEEVDFSKKERKTECFYCSWNRRRIIFHKAEELGCNKMAFGHHLDDAVQTLMLNMVYHGTISSMPYDLSMFEGKLRLIRPLLDIYESDLIEYADLVDFPKLKSECPYGDDTQRKRMKQMIDELAHLSPFVRKNLFRAPSRVFEEYIPH